MKLAEQDPELAVRGYVLSKLKLSPFDQSFMLLNQNDMMLSFTAHWLNKNDQDQVQEISRILGTEWTRDQVEMLTSKKKGSDAPIDKITTPLALALRPEMVEFLKSVFEKKSNTIGGGDYKTSEEIIELDESTSKEQFLQMAAGVGGASASGPRPAPVKERVDPPARVKQMQEQIEAARRASRRSR